MATDLVLVPGMCSVGDVVYQELVEQLKTAAPQLTPHIVNLPSVDGIATKANLEPNALVADINAIKAQIKALVDAGKSVVVVAHSYGGTPALAACEGFWKKQATGAGSVVKAALLSSSLALPGKSVASDREEWKKEQGEPEDPIPGLEPHGNDMFIVPAGFEHAWMNDLPDHAQLRASLKPSPLSTLMTPAPVSDVKSWDIAFLATTDLDLAMAEPFQRKLADRARSNGATVQYETIKSGHFVQVSHKEEVAKWIAGVV